MPPQGVGKQDRANAGNTRRGPGRACGGTRRNRHWSPRLAQETSSFISPCGTRGRGALAKYLSTRKRLNPQRWPAHFHKRVEVSFILSLVLPRSGDQKPRKQGQGCTRTSVQPALSHAPFRRLSVFGGRLGRPSRPPSLWGKG